MKIREILREGAENAPLLTAIELLRGRMRDSGKTVPMSTDSLIQLVRNTGVPFDYKALVSANESDPAVKELVKNFNRDKIYFAPFDSEEGITNSDDEGANNADANAVSKMAKRALNKRS